MKNMSLRPVDDMERIVNQYGDMLYRLSVVMLKNERDAEDIVQETIIQSDQKAPFFENAEHKKGRRLLLLPLSAKRRLTGF